MTAVSKQRREILVFNQAKDYIHMHAHTHAQPGPQVLVFPLKFSRAVLPIQQAPPLFSSLPRPHLGEGGEFLDPQVATPPNVSVSSVKVCFPESLLNLHVSLFCSAVYKYLFQSAEWKGSLPDGPSP